MKPQAVEQATNRLIRAKKAIQDLEGANCYADAESAWADFLLAFNGIYSKLEQGVKGNGSAIAWFGRIKHQRKKSDTLRYLHYARNSEEHGIERVTAEYGGFDSERLRFCERRIDPVRKVDKLTGENYGPEIPVQICGPCIVCVRVIDSRFNDYCDPPTFPIKGVVTAHLAGTKGSDVFTESEFPDLIALDGINLINGVIDKARSYLEQ